MGTSGAVTGSGGIFTITPGMGQTIHSGSGANLFQSFSTFNLGTGDTANFQSGGAANIIARITGHNVSSIDGTMQADANLFFINPAGVMFGANATLNVNGAFTVSTANYVKLNDGGIFYAQLGGASDNLTSAPVSAFGFLSGATPQPISFSGSELINPGGIHVLGGDITLDQAALLYSPSAFLTLFSGAAAGEVPFNLTSPGSGFTATTHTAFGNITMQNGSYAAVDGYGGGKVVIRGGHLVVDGSGISSANYGSSGGGSISIQADQLDVQDGAQITATANASGDAGSVSIRAGSFTIDGQEAAYNGYATGIFTDSQSNDPDAPGKAGLVSITVDDVMAMKTGASISASTVTAGDGGTIMIHARSLSLENVSKIISQTASPDNTITASGGMIMINVDDALSLGFSRIDADSDSSGHAGQVQVTVGGNLAINEGARISSAAFAAGNGNIISVQTGSLDINGNGDPFNFTGISADAQPGATGNAGQVNVTVNGDLGLAGRGQIGANTSGSGNAGEVNVTVEGHAGLSDGGQIDSITFDTGNAGNVTVQAESMDIDVTPGSTLFTGIRSSTRDGSTGNGGQVNVLVTGDLNLNGAAEIGSGTVGPGDAGDVMVQAANLTINGSVESVGVLQGIESDADQGSTGHAGKVDVEVAGKIVLSADGEIASSTFGEGNGGNVTVNAGSLIIDGSADAGNALTGITSQANSTSTGDAGTVNVSVQGSAYLTGTGEIASSTFSSGNAGKIIVQAGSLMIDGESAIVSETVGSTGTAGQIEVNIAGTLLLTGMGEIDTVTTGSGDAGSVQVNAGSLVVENGAEISTATFSSGNAGSIQIQADTLTMIGFDGPSVTGIASNSVSADPLTGGNAGSVSVNVAGPLGIYQGAQISATTNTAGQGGQVHVKGQSILIDGIDSLGSASGITAEAKATGNGGDLFVTAGDLTLSSGGEISSSSQASDAGNISITSNNLTLGAGGSIDTGAALNGGSITLKIGKLVHLLDSQISASAQLSGGNIMIDPQFVVLDNSVIKANAPQGQGGNITIITDNFLNQDSLITASGLTDGTINISSPVLDLSGSLVPLASALVDNEKRLRENCVRSTQHEYSSLTLVGRGGIETAPDELQPDCGIQASSSSVSP